MKSARNAVATNRCNFGAKPGELQRIDDLRPTFGQREVFPGSAGAMPPENLVRS